MNKIMWDLIENITNLGSDYENGKVGGGESQFSLRRDRDCN